MNNGYIISAITDIEKRQATTLAYTIKSSMPDVNVTLVTNNLQQIEMLFNIALIARCYITKSIRFSNDNNLVLAIHG